MTGRARGISALLLFAAACALVFAGPASARHRQAKRLPHPRPLIADYSRVAGSETPPTQAQCAGAVNSAGAPSPRRCFAPAAYDAAYGLDDLHAAGQDGRGYTIAIVDSYGSDTIAHDLRVFSDAFGLQHLCGEE